jgi:predicted RNase H-like nuclease (RuvC/YqgF family)
MSEKAAKANRAEDKVQAGERQAVKASEETTRRNVKMVLEFSNETRKMLKELTVMFDALQGNVMAMKAEQEQYKLQLANLQQQFYARGTVSYADGDQDDK